MDRKQHQRFIHQQHGHQRAPPLFQGHRHRPAGKPLHQPRDPGVHRFRRLLQPPCLHRSFRRPQLPNMLPVPAINGHQRRKLTRCRIRHFFPSSLPIPSRAGALFRESLIVESWCSQRHLSVRFGTKHTPLRERLCEDISCQTQLLVAAGRLLARTLLLGFRFRASLFSAPSGGPFSTARRLLLLVDIFSSSNLGRRNYKTPRKTKVHKEDAEGKRPLCELCGFVLSLKNAARNRV